MTVRVTETSLKNSLRYLVLVTLSLQIHMHLKLKRMQLVEKKADVKEMQ